MTKVIIVYDSKYGNTKHAAETIVQGMEEAQEIETILSEVKNLDFDSIKLNHIKFKRLIDEKTSINTQKNISDPSRHSNSLGKR